MLCCGSLGGGLIRGRSELVKVEPCLFGFGAVTDTSASESVNIDRSDGGSVLVLCCGSLGGGSIRGRSELVKVELLFVLTEETTSSPPSTASVNIDRSDGGSVLVLCCGSLGGGSIRGRSELVKVELLFVLTEETTSSPPSTASVVLPSLPSSLVVL